MKQDTKDTGSLGPRPHGVAIRACICKHEFQDRAYGPGLRVHHRIRSPQKPTWRCTVCRREHD